MKRSYCAWIASGTRRIGATTARRWLSILADDFTGLTVSSDPITKALLMVNPPGAGRDR